MQPSKITVWFSELLLKVLQSEREQELLAIWRDLSRAEEKHDESIGAERGACLPSGSTEEGVRRSDFHSLCEFWRRAVLAWKGGRWNAIKLAGAPEYAEAASVLDAAAPSDVVPTTAAGASPQQSGPSPEAMGTSSPLPTQSVAAVQIVNAVLALDKAFRYRAGQCLRDLGRAAAPENTELTESDALVSWADIPTEGGFRAARRGGPGRRTAVSDEQKKQDRICYTRYKKWALHRCFVGAAELKEHLRTAEAMPENSRGAGGVPKTFQKIRAASDRPTVREHALLLCRVGGLRKAVAHDADPELERSRDALGGSAHAAAAAKELERLMELGPAELEAERAQIARRMGHAGAGGFGLDVHPGGVSASMQPVGVVFLFRVWLYMEGARRLGAEDEWRCLLSTASALEVDAPSRFSLDDADFDVVRWLSEGTDSNHVRRGKMPLLGAWWRFAWDAACSEVRRRGGVQRSGALSGRLWLERGGPKGEATRYTAEEFYRELFTVPAGAEEREKRERTLTDIWHDLAREEERRGRPIEEELGRFTLHTSGGADSKFDFKTLCAFWRHAVLAWSSGLWKRIDYTCSLEEPIATRGAAEGDRRGRRAKAEVAPGTSAAASPSPAEAKITLGTSAAALRGEGQMSSPPLSDIPRGLVEVLDDGWFKWRKYLVQAWSFDEGYALLNARWREQQQRHAFAVQLEKQRKEEYYRMEPVDAHSGRGSPVLLKHPRYKQHFEGRLFDEGRKFTFVENGTWVRVAAEVPTGMDLRGRVFKHWVDTTLYNALRGEHAKLRRRTTLDARRQRMEESGPKAVTDLGVRGKTEAGRLIYTWRCPQGVDSLEVEVTPRRLRPELAEDVTQWKQRGAREATPDRGLRKMKQKYKRHLDKAARGEVRIVARTGHAGPTGDAPPDGAASETCPALAKLDDPVVLGHLRDAYNFLGSARLHYCQNCDEEWMVFDALWPQGGVPCAGPKAGKCETIERAGYEASRSKPGWCSRCAAQRSVYRDMFSEENGQHLGERHEALSNLTWYESLLIARVHPVISVVTLTATGLLCYAGHVCNYYVKVLEWFRGLPAILRDKKWFLIKRRRSIQASAVDNRQKKPTTANRRRLEAGIAAAMRCMPRVYADSDVVQEHLEKFPLDGEREMLEQEESVDLSGEVRMDREMFSAWAAFGQRSPKQYPCAAALMQYAADRQRGEVGGAVTGDTAWELSCRLLHREPAEQKAMGTRDLASLLVFLLGSEGHECQVPGEMRVAVYQGMLQELRDRRKRIETSEDTECMQLRWVRQLLHSELDSARETWLDTAAEPPIDLEVDGEMQEPEMRSMTVESEQEAAKILEAVAADIGGGAGQEQSDHRAPEEDEGECWNTDAEEGWDADPGGEEQRRSTEAEAAVAAGAAAEATGGSEVRAARDGDVQGATAAEPPVAGDARPPDQPLVDPPPLGDRIRDTEKEAFWIPGAFPTIFQNEKGDPYDWKLKEPDLVKWGPHILRSKGWAAQTHMTFMYWWMNMIQRIQALSAKKWYVKDNPQALGYTVEDLSHMSVGQLAKKMVGYTANIPGTKAQKSRLRRLILTMVRQIEIETRSQGVEAAGGADGNVCLGDVPCLFGTLTTQRYHWDEIIRTIAEVEGIGDYKSLSKSKRRELVNKYPLFVAWYCSVRLELTLKTMVVPIFGASAYVAVFEWSPTGGTVHLHYVLWKPGAPRFDIRAEQLQERADALRKAGLAASGYARCRVDDVVDFFAEYVSEWNPNKDSKGEEESSHVAERVNEAQEHTAALSVEEMLRLLQEESSDERRAYYKRVVRTEHMHDFHYPDPQGAPNPAQPCARLLKGTLNMWYCGNGYPKDMVCQPCDQSVAQDGIRPDLWRVNLCRNCRLMNSHMPAVSLLSCTGS